MVAAPASDLRMVQTALVTDPFRMIASRHHRHAAMPRRSLDLLDAEPLVTFPRVFALRDALFNLAVDSKLRGCDLVHLAVTDVVLAGNVRPRASVMQSKTGRPVVFELTDASRESVLGWLRLRPHRNGDWLFPSRNRSGQPMTTRQYARLLNDWLGLAGLDHSLYGTHSLRRTKVALIYKRTGNLRPCQLLLGYTTPGDTTVRYPGVELDDALELSEQVDL
nr:tyrosine-type recombinase/integrase [Phreatobacter sp.]